MSVDNQAAVYATQKTNLAAPRVLNTLNLLYKEKNTIPFIARYRKEVTGNMDEVQIRSIQDFYEEYLEIEKRRAYILETIKKMDKLTPDLEKKILAASTLNVLEDIYAPYKSKKKTKATLAKENGLEPLAHLLLTSKEDLKSIKAKVQGELLGKTQSVDEALSGASDIILEVITQNTELKEELRQDFWKLGVVTASQRKEAQEIEGWDKFKDFFEFSESVENIKDPKNTHRFLALRRGFMLKVLKLDINIDEEMAIKKVISFCFEDFDSLGAKDFLEKLAGKAYRVSLRTSLDLELKTELKKIADEAAISVFGVNLKNLLLQPYLGSHAVLGIDPGIRTGCKVVVIDATGKYITDHVIFPFAPKNDIVGSKTLLEGLIEAFKIEYIAIGNGTNGRETLDFINDHIKAVQDGKVKASMINESGASIYSASDIARKEFPDKDVTVRGAISIARRFQDPLAELVKIDPKSIGVGQYQHDVNQVRLKKQLGAVVEDCVNYVGVDLNTASAPLLSYISGIGPSIAENIVKTRESKGIFKSRQSLLKVSRFSEKIFEQSAGFLRIYNGENPLDGTFIHPENYPILENWCKANQIELSDLVQNNELITKLSHDHKLRQEIGELTFKDMIDSLRAPKQDPRSEFKPVEFRKDVRVLSDLKVGSWYTGIVNNITNFGAFIDLGVKESGLLHVSQMADHFVKDPMQELKVGETVKVKVTELDIARKRIGLTRKSDDQQDTTFSSGINKAKSKQKANKEIKNSAFAGLAHFKV